MKSITGRQFLALVASAGCLAVSILGLTSLVYLLGYRGTQHQGRGNDEPDRPNPIGGAESPLLRLADQEGGIELPEFLPISSHTGELAFSPDEKLVAMPSADDGTVAIWAVGIKTVHVLKNPTASPRARAIDVTFSADGRLLAVVYESPGLVAVWDVRKGVPSNVFDFSSRTRDPNKMRDRLDQNAKRHVVDRIAR